MSDSTPTYAKRTSSKAPLIIVGVIVVAIVVALVAFFTAQSTEEATGDELNVGLVLEPTNLDIRENPGVATGQVLIDNVYQGLVGIASGTETEIVPVLATDMPTVSDDGLEYTFTLRDDVTFHSGAPLTATDVVDSLTETLTDDTVGTAPSITSDGAHTVTVTLAEPNSQLLWLLANYPGVILESAATNDLQSSANGTGPFIFSEWKQGDSITLERNAEYWGEPALVETAVFQYYPDERAAVNALKEGDIDVQAPLSSSLRAEFDNDNAFELVRADSSDVFTLAYNSAQAPLNDPRVRQALSMAIDSEALLAAQHGDGKVLGGPITELEPGYEDLSDIHAYDPDAARALLAEAGHPNLSLTVTVANFYPTATLDLVTSQLAEVGVAVTVKQVEFGAWLEDVYMNKDYQLSYVDHAEARDFGNYANPDYYFGYSNPEVQQLFTESLATTDPATEERLLAEAARLVAEDAPAKWLYNYTPTNVISAKVDGFPTVNTNSRINLAGVSIQE